MNNNQLIWSGEDRFLQIKDWLDKFDGKSVLEIGIGGGDISRYLSRRNIVLGLDINIDFLKKSKANIDNLHFVRADAKNLPFRPKSFDVIICREVIEHLDKMAAERLLTEIYVLLKSDGVLLLSTPNRLSPEGIISSAILKIMGKEWNAWSSDHRHIYNTFELKNLLKNHNFSLKELRGEYHLFLPIPILAKVSPVIFKFFRKMTKTLDNKLGCTRPFSNFGFVVEYRYQKI